MRNINQSALMAMVLAGGMFSGNEFEIHRYAGPFNDVPLDDPHPYTPRPRHSKYSPHQGKRECERRMRRNK
jgi:hypothetical protein